MGAEDLDIWADYVTVINAPRLNAMRSSVISNENNLSNLHIDIASNSTQIYNLDLEKLDIDGSLAMTGALNMGTCLITNMTTPTAYHHAVNKSVTDNISEAVYNISSTYFRHDGSIRMSGEIDMYNNNLTNVHDIYFAVSGTRISYPSSLYIGKKPDENWFLFWNDNLWCNRNVIPYTNSTWSLGDSAHHWNSFYGTNATFTQDLSVSRNFNLSGNLNISGNLSLSGNFYSSNLVFECDNNSGVIIDGVSCKDGKTSDIKSMPFHIDKSYDNSTVWLLGSGSGIGTYQFNQTVKLKDYRFTGLAAGDGAFTIHINDSAGLFNNESIHWWLGAGGIKDSISLSDFYVTPSNGIEIMWNGSNVSHLTITLNYE